MIELLNEIKSATINTQKKICLKATTHSQADEHHTMLTVIRLICLTVAL